MSIEKRLGGLCLSPSQVRLESIALRTSTEKTGKRFPKSNPVIKLGRTETLGRDSSP